MSIVLIIMAAICALTGAVGLAFYLSICYNPQPSHSEGAMEKKLKAEKIKYFTISLIVSEILSIFFLLLAGSPKHWIMQVNGILMLVYAFLFLVFTIRNAVRQDEIDLKARFYSHFAVLAFAVLLLGIAKWPADIATISIASVSYISLAIQAFAILYFLAAIVALLFLFWDALKLERDYLRHYLLWVMITGIAVGTGLFIISSTWQFFFA